MNRCNLVLHCGGYKVGREKLAEVVTPANTKTHFPIAHEWLVQQVEAALNQSGMDVVEQAHALATGGSDYFGMLQVQRRNEPQNKDYSYVVGIRNSNACRWSAGLAVGHQVFVCDNLAFNGEIKIARKHTPHIARDLPVLAVRAIGLLSEKWFDNDRRIECYKNREISPIDLHDLTIRALDVGALTTINVPRVLKEFRDPRHPEFTQSPNVWRFFNACTEVGKGAGLFVLPRRTTNLHALCDGFVGLTPARHTVLDGTVDAEVTVNLN